MWSSAVLAAGHIKAMVIYSGRETRIVINSRQPRSKVSRMDRTLNLIGKVLFVIMLVMSVSLVFLSGRLEFFPLKTMRYLVLLTSILPISIKTSLEVARLYLTYRISNDKSIEGTVARNTNIPDELGRISFALMDKTGTLTENQMVFKKMCLLDVSRPVHLAHEEEKKIWNFVAQDEHAQETHEGLMLLCAANDDHHESMSLHEDVTPRSMLERHKTGRRRGSVEIGGNASEAMLLRQLIYSMAVCHNVMTLEEDGEVYYQAASPDEIALISIAKKFGVALVSRTQTKPPALKIRTVRGMEEIFTVLDIFPFSSETKQMGIVVRHEASQTIVYYVKGADTVIQNIVHDSQQGFSHRGVRRLGQGRAEDTRIRLQNTARETIQRMEGQAAPGSDAVAGARSRGV